MPSLAHKHIQVVVGLEIDEAKARIAPEGVPVGNDDESFGADRARAIVHVLYHGAAEPGRPSPISAATSRSENYCASA